MLKHILSLYACVCKLIYRKCNVFFSYYLIISLFFSLYLAFIHNKGFNFYFIFFCFLSQFPIWVRVSNNTSIYYKKEHLKIIILYRIKDSTPQNAVLTTYKLYLTQCSSLSRYPCAFLISNLLLNISYSASGSIS